jgi:hypothetical protein
MTPTAKLPMIIESKANVQKNILINTKCQRGIDTICFASI